MSSRRYICAFRGRRDAYQVPLALAEDQKLESFITDIYTYKWIGNVARYFPVSLRDKIRSRRKQQLPDRMVHCLWRTALEEWVSHTVGIPAANIYAKYDKNYSIEAAKAAQHTKSNLFLYTPYAWEAFTAKYAHSPKKILFQYHPHPATERQVIGYFMGRDNLNEIHWSKNYEVMGYLSDRESNRIENCWKYADSIICASSFTKKSLIDAGAQPDQIWVIPYGIDMPPENSDETSAGSFKVLYVGTGIPRKGLHHLITAWKRAKLPAGSKLTLVCRILDPIMEELIQKSKNVCLIKGLSLKQLTNEYKRASLFAMPSLIEGFGQVYLEALSFGLPVLGTVNTCLPDIGNENDGIYCIEPGNIEQLIAYLERLAFELPGNSNIRKRARLCASRFTWVRFRDQLRERL